METLFKTEYTTFLDALVQLGILLLILGGLLWATFLITSKLLYRKQRQRKEASLRLAFLWSLVIVFFCFNIYLFFLAFGIEEDRFVFDSLNFYLGLIAQVIILLCFVVVYLLRRHSLKKLISQHNFN